MYFEYEGAGLKHLKTFVVAMSIFSLLSCSSTVGPAQKMAKSDQNEFLKPLRKSKSVPTDNDEQLSANEGAQSHLEVITPPRLSIDDAATQAKNYVAPNLSDKKVTRQSFSNLPIPAFINEVYGNQLNLDFIIQPGLQKAPDLVTMRLNSQLSEKAFYELATSTLESYGVSTYLNDGMLVFDYSPEAADAAKPIIATGMALPDVPEGNRPVFYVYPLTATRTPEVNGILSQMFSRKEITIREDMYRNALIINGKSAKVRQVVEAIKLLDRPSMAGMASAILRPEISTVDEMAESLRKILQTEGFNVKNGDTNTPIRLLPLASSGQLIVFSKSQEILDYIVGWARKLENERQGEITNGLFTYQVQSTQASHVVELLTSLGFANSAVTSSVDENLTSSGGQSQRNTSSRGSGTFAVDEKLNTILFSGSGDDWSRAVALIKKLDKPAPSVMIEVVLLEVTLDENENSAIEWLFNSGLGSYDVVGSTLGALGESSSGLSLSLSSGSETRAAMDFLYKNSKTQIRSRPRVMVQSGAEASIEVGDKIPVVTSSSQSTSSENAPIVQTVSYQDTGVLLSIKPIVHATGFVDIEISQELSEVSTTNSGFEDSPAISSRKIETILTLRDGGSVLIGGLIRANDSDANTGVPGLGKLPIIGKLFSGDSKTFRRTELLMMVIPYILTNPDEVESLSDEMQQARMQMLEDFE